MEIYFLALLFPYKERINAWIGLTPNIDSPLEVSFDKKVDWLSTKASQNYL